MSPAVTEPLRRRRRWLRWLPWLLLVVVAVPVLARGGAWVYIKFIKEPAPAPLTFENRDAQEAKASGTLPSASPASSGPGTVAELDGKWTVVAPSTIGYRVKEILVGLATEGVGRTDKISGDITVSATTVTSAELAVDLESLKSDDERRDAQFRTRLMDVENFPVGLFTLTKPIEVGQLPDIGSNATAVATGDLSLRGVTVAVTIDVTATRTADALQLVGQIPVKFADFEIPDPSVGPVQTEDHGIIEFKVTLARQ